MSTGAAGRWPFPGLVWGEYPQRPLPLKPREKQRTRAAVYEAFARAAVAGGSIDGDASSVPMVRACAALRGTLGIAPRWQQVMAARALLDQKLVEMDTGEGKTYAVALAAAVAASAGAPVHVVTSNDYLAQRDAESLAPFYAALGVRCDFVTEAMDPTGRRSAYAAGVTYVTGKELAFDYLRDSMQAPTSGTALQQRCQRLENEPGADARVLRGLCFAILDEADTMLVDEARTPFVLAQGQVAAGEEEFQRQAWLFAQRMHEGEHFRLEGGGTQVRLLPPARALLSQWAADAHPLHGHAAHREALVLHALTAMHVLARGRDYVVRDDAIALVDAASGRASRGRAWSRGLHQMVERKEALPPSQRHETVAQVTYQRFFARYLRLAGISGTLRESARELSRVYGLSLVRVGPHHPRRVVQGPARCFPDSASLWQAVAARAGELAGTNRPVLVGVSTVSQSQALSAELDRVGLAHQLLNAEHDAHEREVLANAGQAGCITVATSMAGRGSDIVLDAAALEAGGLHVLLCQLNGSRRIDRQFLGRAGRQGQPGSTEHWLAADFPGIPRRFAGVANSLSSQAGATNPAISLMLWIYQAIRTYTDMKQRVTLLWDAQAQERELAFDRNLLI